MNHKKWKYDNDSIDSWEYWYREIDAKKLTKERYQLIKRYVKRHNRQWFAPYGTSRQGYPYTCGHEWDCCGCIIRNRMTIEFISGKLVIHHFISYNY